MLKSARKARRALASLLVKHVCVHARTHMHARIRADDELTVRVAYVSIRQHTSAFANTWFPHMHAHIRADDELTDY